MKNSNFESNNEAFLEKYLEDLKDGYCDEKGIMKEAFVTDYPKKLAQYLSEITPAVTFGDIDCVYLCYQLLNPDVEDEKKYIRELRIELFKSLGDIVREVKQGKLPDVFRLIVEENIKAIKGYKDVDAFHYFMELLEDYYPIESNLSEFSEEL